MRPRKTQSGFTLIEMLVAATVFSFMAAIIGGIYSQVLNLQRRAQGAGRVQENALFVIESVAREVRVSVITSPLSNCSGGSSPVESSTIILNHPVEGVVQYDYDSVNGWISRNGKRITSPEVEFLSFAFIVDCSAGDDVQARVTMPMTVANRAIDPRNQTQVSIQTTVVSRDLVTDLTN